MGKENTLEKPEYGTRLRKLRESMGMTQREFAAKMEFSNSAVSEFESMANKPGYTILAKLHSTFNISIDYILFGKGSPFIDDMDKRFSEFDLGDRKESVMELLEQMEKSPIFMHNILAMAYDFLATNRKLIETDTKLNQKIKQKKVEIVDNPTEEEK
jgi:transcriptional regulator with XRE-family HTH domain